MQASEVSLGDNLQRVDMQHLIGDDSFQASILVLEGSHLCDVADVHAAELGLPLVERRGADPVAATELGRVGAGLRLFNDPDDLGFVNRDLRIWATPCGQLPREFALIAGILSWAQVSMDFDKHTYGL